MKKTHTLTIVFLLDYACGGGGGGGSYQAPVVSQSNTTPLHLTTSLPSFSELKAEFEGLL